MTEQTQPQPYQQHDQITFDLVTVDREANAVVIIDQLFKRLELDNRQVDGIAEFFQKRAANGQYPAVQ